MNVKVKCLEEERDNLLKKFYELQDCYSKTNSFEDQKEDFYKQLNRIFNNDKNRQSFEKQSFVKTKKSVEQQQDLSLPPIIQPLALSASGNLPCVSSNISSSFMNSCIINQNSNLFKLEKIPTTSSTFVPIASSEVQKCIESDVNVEIKAKSNELDDDYLFKQSSIDFNSYLDQNILVNNSNSIDNTKDVDFICKQMSHQTENEIIKEETNLRCSEKGKLLLIILIANKGKILNLYKFIHIFQIIDFFLDIL